MIDNHPPEYKIQPDEEPPDSIFTKKPAKRWDRTPPETSRFRSLFPIFLLVLMGLALGYTYWDLRGQILQINTSGDQKTQTIAENFESKISFLSVKVAALEDGTTRIDKTLADHTSAVSKLQQAINALQADLKATRGGVDNLKTETEKKGNDIATMAIEVKNLGASIKPLETEVKTQRAAISAEVKGALEDVKSVQAQLSTLSNDIKPLKAMEVQFQKQVTQLDNNIKQEETRVNQELDKAISKLTMQILTLKQKIADMESSQPKSAPRQQPASVSPAEPKSSAPASTPAPPAAKQPGTPPKPGEVLERDLGQ